MKLLLTVTLAEWSVNRVSLVGTGTVCSADSGAVWWSFMIHCSMLSLWLLFVI